MIQTERPLKQLFGDVDYAWELLQIQVKIETSNQVSGEDVSNLLQLYMKGVEKMNSFLDFRENYFKQKVMTLMSRPTVIKTLNTKTIMSKKKIVPEANTSKENSDSKIQSPSKSDKNGSIGSAKKLQNKSQIYQLKQKKREIQVRLAYDASQNSPELVQKLVTEHAQKQTKLTQKIQKIVNNHEQRLANRIKERKLKTAAKSLSNILINNENNGGSSKQITIEMRNKLKIQETFGSCKIIDQREQNNEAKQKLKQRIKKAYKSLSPKRGKKFSTIYQSPLRKTISYNLAVHVSHENIKMWDFSKLIQ